MEPLDYPSKKQSVSRKYILRIIWGITLVFCIQISTFFLFGKRSLHTEHFKYSTTYIKEEGSIGILLPIKAKEHEKLKISTILKDKFEVIEILENEVIYTERHRLNPNSFGSSHEIKYNPPFFATVTTEKGTLFYGETWKMEFIWILGTWVIMKNENIGQS